MLTRRVRGPVEPQAPGRIADGIARRRAMVSGRALEALRIQNRDLLRANAEPERPDQCAVARYAEPVREHAA